MVSGTAGAACSSLKGKSGPFSRGWPQANSLGVVALTRRADRHRWAELRQCSYRGNGCLTF